MRRNGLPNNRPRKDSDGVVRRQGHATVVEGCFILKKGSASEGVDALVVAGGWCGGARCVSFYHTKLTDTYGVFFS